jgi:hypothetical protein
MVDGVVRISPSCVVDLFQDFDRRMSVFTPEKAPRLGGRNSYLAIASFKETFLK